MLYVLQMQCFGSASFSCMSSRKLIELEEGKVDIVESNALALLL